MGRKRQMLSDGDGGSQQSEPNSIRPSQSALFFDLCPCCGCRCGPRLPRLTPGDDPSGAPWHQRGNQVCPRSIARPELLRGHIPPPLPTSQTSTPCYCATLGRNFSLPSAPSPPSAPPRVLVPSIRTRLPHLNTPHGTPAHASF